MPQEDQEQVVAYLLTKPVTKCPTVFLSKTRQASTNTLSRREKNILREHERLQTLFKEAKLKELFYNKQVFSFLIGLLFLPVCKMLTWLSWLDWLS